MRILVPLDGSTYCQAAVRMAFQLASQLKDAELHGIHVVNVRPPSGSLLSDISGYVGFEPAIVTSEVYESHMKAAQSMVDTFVSRALTEGVSADGEVLVGPVTEKIVEESHLSDLVIMGLRGESEDRYPGQGGAQAPNALPQVSVPVLLVPREVTQVRTIAVGYDGSPAAKHALKAVKLLCGIGAEVHLIYVGDPDVGRSILEEAVEELEGATTGLHFVAGEEVHATLMRTAEQVKADVLALGFEGSHRLKDVFLGSSQEHLLHENLRVALLISH